MMSPRVAVVGGRVTLGTGAVDAAPARWNGAAVRGFSNRAPWWPGVVAVSIWNAATVS